MKLLYRSRLLLNGLKLPSAIRCIDGLAKLRTGKSLSDFEISYNKTGKQIKAQVRGNHLASDLQTVLELAAGDCYRLKEISWNPDLVIDCGGNTGLFTLAASTRWPSANIMCFEPMPENFDLIQKHLRLNRLSERVEIIKAAVGATARHAKFFVREANQGSLDESLEFGNSIDVEVLRLWDIYSNHLSNQVLIKLDIEGAEFEILHDFFKHAPLRNLVMLMEVHGNRKAQDELLSAASHAGMVGSFWERGSETAHLYLASKDVGFVLNKR